MEFNPTNNGFVTPDDTRRIQSINNFWNNDPKEFKRIAMACLIEGVYWAQKDREAKRLEENAFSTKWFSFFNYTVANTFIDPNDNTIFGAILKWDESSSYPHFKRPASAPKAVVALRGTMLGFETVVEDMKADCQLFLWEKLDKFPRFIQVLEMVRVLCNTYTVEEVCITGHSLGAAYALQVGKKLAEEEGLYVDTYLFNPPCISLARFLRKIGQKVEMMCDLFKYQILSKEKRLDLGQYPCRKSKDGDAGQWSIYLYVNCNDPICASYVEPPSALQNSLGIKIKKYDESWSPCSGRFFATLNIVRETNQSFSSAHGLRQWWDGTPTIVQIEMDFKNQV